jgi:hypothetical protein
LDQHAISRIRSTGGCHAIRPLLPATRPRRRLRSSGSAGDECQHLRRENQHRQALTVAGARQLRIGGPACAGTRLFWFKNKGGFMRIGS